MENKKTDSGRFLLVIADTEKKEIIVNERVSCIVGGFAKDGSTAILKKIHCMGFSSASPELAITTARAAERSAKNVKNAAIELMDDSLLGRIKKMIKKIFGGRTDE